MAVYASRAEETNRKRDNRRKTSKLQIFRPYRHRQGRRRKFFARITIGKDGDANPSPVSSSARPTTQILRPCCRRQSRRHKSFSCFIRRRARQGRCTIVIPALPAPHGHSPSRPVDPDQLINSSFSSRAPEAASRGQRESRQHQSAVVQ